MRQGSKRLFARMSLGEYEADGVPEQADYVYEAMFKLLTDVANSIVGANTGIGRDDALSLVGRALFLRFLGDRGIVTAGDIAPGATRLDDCFADATKASPIPVTGWIPHSTAIACRSLSPEARHGSGECLLREAMCSRTCAPFYAVRNRRAAGIGSACEWTGVFLISPTCRWAC